MLCKFLEVDLEGSCELPPISAHYDWLRLLIRVRGRPIGYLDLDNDPAQLEPSTVRARAIAAFSEKIWEALLPERWKHTPPDDVPDQPAVSVIICTRNRPELLKGCLAAVSAQQYPNYEVIVVDNAPTDTSTRQVAERFDVRYVVEPRGGLDWARNRGLTESAAPIVAYTDDDARPDPRWLEELVAGFTSVDIEAVTGLVVPAELETEAQVLFEDGYGGMGKGFTPALHSSRGWKKIGYHPERCGVGCNMAFRRDALERLGGFDPALDVGTATGGGGDLDIFQRLVETGAVIAYRPDAIVLHKHRRTWAALQRQLFDNGRAYSATLWATLVRARGPARLHVMGRYWHWLWHWHVRRIVRRLFRRGEPMPLKFLLAELRGALLGPMVYTLARRHARRLA